MSEHETTRRAPPDLTVQWRTFAGIGSFILVIAVVYWFSSYDYAGSVMLGLASALAFFNATYLWLRERAGAKPAPLGERQGDLGGGAAVEEHYLPHASPWPFGIGVGAFLAANGLILGFAYAVPGVIVVGISIAGVVAQTRRRA
jgi:hypothetical protein